MRCNWSEKNRATYSANQMVQIHNQSQTRFDLMRFSSRAFFPPLTWATAHHLFVCLFTFPVVDHCNFVSFGFTPQANENCDIPARKHCLNVFSLRIILGTPPSTEKPYGPYPLVIIPDSNPDARVLVVQDFAYGKYLGKLKVDFDADGEVIKWSGNPILLDNSVKKDPKILQQVQQMKSEVSKVSEVRDKFFTSLVSRARAAFYSLCVISLSLKLVIKFAFSGSHDNCLPMTVKNPKSAKITS